MNRDKLLTFSVFAILAFTMNVSFLARIAGALETNVDWKDNVITAKGNSVASPLISNEAQAKLLARRGAVVDGYRGIAEAVAGVQIDAKTTVKDFAIENDKIDAQLSTFVKGAQITKEEFKDGVYTVEMSAPINGDGSLAGIIGKTLQPNGGQTDAEIASQIEDDVVDLEENIITATGHGLPPENPVNPEQAKLMARRAAQIDGYRNLAEFANGVQVDSTTTVQNLITSNDTVNSSVSGLIQGAKIIKEKQNTDNSYELTMSLPITGPNSLAETTGKDLIWDYDFSSVSDKSPAVEKLTNGEVDWEDGIIVAQGTGISPKDSVGSQARMLARRAAIVEGQRNLGEIIDGVTVNGQTSIKDLVVANDITTAEMSSYISNFKIIKEEYPGNGAYKVALALKIEGTGALEDLVVDENSPSETAPAFIEEGITGLVVDASGLGIKPAMSPKIIDENGVEVYGSIKNLDAKYAVKNGIADYVVTLFGAAESGRGGDNPIAIKALRAGTSENKCDIVISNDNASKIRAENEKSGFLKATRVVIIL
jgi:hypothetical protein